MKTTTTALDLTTCPIADLGAAVAAAIARMGSSDVERFGDKVFISSIYLAIAALGTELLGSLASFKVRLIAANRAGVVQLARIDVPMALSDDARRAMAHSETFIGRDGDIGATVHAVIDQPTRSARERSEPMPTLSAPTLGRVGIGRSVASPTKATALVSVREPASILMAQLAETSRRLAAGESLGSIGRAGMVRS